jgi:HAD superfamily hydrolase (TIGR01662 family)
MDTPRRPFDVIFFDLGNTLIYSDAVGVDLLAQGSREMFALLERLGYRLEVEMAAQRFLAYLESCYAEREQTMIETPTIELLRRFLAEHGQIHPATAHLEQALEAFYAPSEAHWQPEMDAHLTLQTLRSSGYRLGLISNAGDDSDVQRLIDKAGLRFYFEHMVVSARVGWRKPSPYIFNYALSLFGVAAERAAMVGDMLYHDILGARQAGLTAFWITRRAQTPENVRWWGIAQPHATLAQLSDLPPLLATWPPKG